MKRGREEEEERHLKDRNQRPLQRKQLQEHETKDATEKERWLTVAVEQGDWAAMNELGTLFRRFRSMEQGRRVVQKGS
jgi:hypothetical protein